MDDKTKLCVGCWRTIEEIAGWGGQDDFAKMKILQVIEQRKKTSEAAP